MKRSKAKAKTQGAELRNAADELKKQMLKLEAMKRDYLIEVLKAGLAVTDDLSEEEMAQREAALEEMALDLMRMNDEVIKSMADFSARLDAADAALRAAMN